MEGRIMSNNIETIVLAFIFVILLVVVFKPIRSAFNLDTFPSCVLSRSRAGPQADYEP